MSQKDESKKWDLTPYEQQRMPQELITDDTKIAVHPRSLNSDFVCPICLDIFTNTMATKECLHRFCQKCIITALRSGNKECPTCRKKLISKRSLRPDPNFDMLISLIFPNRDEYEAEQDREIAKINESKLMPNFKEKFCPQSNKTNQPVATKSSSELNTEGIK